MPEITNQKEKLNDSFKKVFETKWFSIEASSTKYSEGKPYYRFSCNDSVEILAITPEKKIILIRQYRPSLESYTLELPAGYINDNEAAEEAIKREFCEETGFNCDSIEYMGAFKIAPSRINNTLHVFFGKNARLENDIKDDKNKVVLVSPDEFKKLIAEGNFTEMAGLALYFLAQQNGFL